MFDYRRNLSENKTRSTPTGEMARKLYLSYPTCAFADIPEIEYQVRDAASNLYSVPISAIQVTGSAKTGFSLIKGTDFDPKKSDLDLAVIDQRFFSFLWEQSHLSSNGFSADRFDDPRDEQGEVVIGGGRKRFLNYVQRGVISPYFMPSSPLRANLIRDAAQLGTSFRTHFKKITVFFYASEFFFHSKQEDSINKHWGGI